MVPAISTSKTFVDCECNPLGGVTHRLGGFWNGLKSNSPVVCGHTEFTYFDTTNMYFLCGKSWGSKLHTSRLIN